MELNFFNKLFYSFTLNQIIKKYKNYEYCFFGLITSYNIHAINKIDAKYNVLIDDGNEIFLILDNILVDIIIFINLNKFFYKMNHKIPIRKLSRSIP